MANNIIRSYLVSLGFKTDKTQLSNFKNTLGGVDKSAKTVSKSIIAIAVAAEYMVAAFSHSMEKLYYASQRTKSSVANIKALEYGAQQVGIEAGVATQALESMAAAVRMNPGMRGLMNRIVGKDTGQMDQSVALLEMIQKLGQMPHFQGARFAGMFGMDEQTFLMMVQKAPELLAAQQKYLELQRQSGVDMDAAAKSSQEYANKLRDIKTQLDIITTQLLVEALPLFNELHKKLSELLTDWIAFNNGTGSGKTGFITNELNALNYALDVTTFRFKKLAEVATQSWAIVKSFFKPGGGGQADAIKAWDALKKAYAAEAPKPPTTGGSGATSGATGSSSKTSGITMTLEEARRLDAADGDMLANNKYKKELQRVKPFTKPDYPITFNGKPLSGYSSPLDALSNTKLGAGAGGTNINMQQKTDIHINGVNDPGAAGKAVVSGQERVNGDICRNLAGCVQ